MEKLIPAADDGSEFAETAYDLSQAEAEKDFGAEFATDNETKIDESAEAEGADHD